MSFFKRYSTQQYILLSLTGPIISLFIYSFTFSYFFFSDDFFNLLISEAHSLNQALNFLLFRNDIIGYRPLTLQSYFFILKKLFDLNPFAFRVTNAIFLIASYILLIFLLKKILKKNSVSIFAAFLWITSAVHFMALAWISAAWIVVGTFFYLTAFLAYIKYLEGKKLTYLLIALGFFTLTLGAFEFSVTLPVMTVFYAIFIYKRPIFEAIKNSASLIIITSVFLIIRFTTKSNPQINDYNLALNLDSLKALFWYFLWAFNIPEEFKNQVSTNLVVLNKTFINNFNQLVLKTTIGFIGIFIFGVIIPFAKLLKSRKSADTRIILFCVSWFLTTLIPVLLIPNHTFSMYVILPSIGIYALIAYLVSNYLNKYFILLLSIIWIYSSVTTINFYKLTSWVVYSQEFSRRFAVQMKAVLPNPAKNSVILYEIKDPRKIQAISGENEAKVVYGDPSITMYFNERSLNEDVQRGKINREKVIRIQ